MGKTGIKHIVRVFLITFAIGLLHFILSSCSEDFIVESRSTKNTSVRHSIGAKEVSIANDGHALHSIIVGSDASERTLDAAEDLATYLSRITGGVFSVKIGDGTKGIAVGTYLDFPQLKFEDLFNSDVIMRRDEFLLRTHTNGVYMVGATDMGAQHAVWGFLNLIGYRQFFAMDAWESIPEISNLSIGVDVFEQPDFFNREGPAYAVGGNRELWQNWHDRNLITSSFVLNTGHSYGGIIRRNRAAFAEHPEYLALVNGVRGGGPGGDAAMKFCISNEGLRQLIVEYAKGRIEDDPQLLCLSLDPSDGSDWCECEPCAQMGSITDRVVTLANEAAEAINNMGHGERYIGIYAYNMHSPPPNIDVHPKVIVSIATDFIRRGWTLGRLLEGWSKRAEMVGIREYYDITKWSFGMPRKAVGGDINYLVENIPYYYNNGARSMLAESANTWSVNGLGYYISSALLWNVDAVNSVDGIVEDFLEKCFRDAKEPMRKFYYMINQDHVTPRSNHDLLAHMYGYIDEAYKLTDNPLVISRLSELATYTRYIELHQTWRGLDKGGIAYIKAAQDVYRHAYRMQGLMFLSLRSVYNEIKRAGVNVPGAVDPGPGGYKLGTVMVDNEPWQSSKLITDDEVAQFIAHGVATYQKDNLGFEPIGFSEDLEPAFEALGLRKVSYGDMGNDNSFDRDHKLFTWFKPTNKQLRLLVTSGLLKRHDENVKFELFSPQEVMVEPVHTDESVPTDGEPYQIVITSPYDGLHQLEWFDGGARTRLAWYKGQPMTVQATMEKPQIFGRNFQLYFYVPKGTKTVGGHTSSNNFQMFDGNSNSVLDLRNVEGGAGYFSVQVPEGQDGTLWELKGINLTLMLMTVPPYLARNGEELLLPKEVIEADKIK